MGYFSKLLKDTKIGKFLKEVGITIGEEKREEKHKVKKKKHNCDFSDNHDDDNWTY
jgi:hypothetical protein